MKRNEFQTSLTGRKKVFAVSVIIGLMLAAISAIGVFAAPSPKTASQVFGNQLRELNSDRAWLTKFMASHRNFVNSKTPNKDRQYIKQYEFALAQAEAIVSGRGTAVIPNTGNPSSSNSSNSSSSSNSAATSTPASSSSSSSSSAATSTATPTDTPTATATVTPGSSSGSSSSSSATSTPTAVVPNTGSSSSSTGTSSNSNVTSFSSMTSRQIQNQQQALAGWLREMRELQEKLSGDSSETNGQ